MACGAVIAAFAALTVPLVLFPLLKEFEQLLGERQLVKRLLQAELFLVLHSEQVLVAPRQAAMRPQVVGRRSVALERCAAEQAATSQSAQTVRPTSVVALPEQQHH